MENALILGASGGIGGAVLSTLQHNGTAVTALSRREQGFDMCQPETVDAALYALEGTFDLILVATGALEIDGASPEKRLASITARSMAAQFALNTIGPALVLRHAPRLLARNRRAIFVALSARVGSISDNHTGGWYAYRAAKAALNQTVHGAAIELRRSHPLAICIAYHPGTVATDLTAAYGARHQRVRREVAAANLMSVLAGLKPEDSGGFLDWQGKTIPW